MALNNTKQDRHLFYNGMHLVPVLDGIYLLNKRGMFVSIAQVFAHPYFKVRHRTKYESHIARELNILT